MKKTIIVLLSVLFTITANAQSKENVLWYKQAAKDWNEALPIGNGRLGAMVFGNCFKETIQLNEESLWAGTKTDANADARQALPEIQQALLNGDINKAIELSEKNMRSNPLRIR